MNVSELFHRCGDPLLERDSNRITVMLFYDRITKEAFVYYNNVKSGECFSIDPPLDRAMDAYSHPIIYADAAMNGRYIPRTVAELVSTGHKK